MNKDVQQSEIIDLGSVTAETRGSTVIAPMDTDLQSFRGHATGINDD